MKCNVLSAINDDNSLCGIKIQCYHMIRKFSKSSFWVFKQPSRWSRLAQDERKICMKRVKFCFDN